MVSYLNLYFIYLGYILIPGAESDLQLPRNEKIKGDAKSYSINLLYGVFLCVFWIIKMRVRARKRADSTI